jgi:hypothetical protein
MGTEAVRRPQQAQVAKGQAGEGLTIRGFEHKLRMVAYACNFTTKCPSQICTAANNEMILLPMLVKGLSNVDIQAELLTEQMLLMIWARLLQ